MQWFTSDKMDPRDGDEKLQTGFVDVGKYYRVEIFSCTLGRVHLGNSNSSTHSFSKELSWSPIDILFLRSRLMLEVILLLQLMIAENKLGKQEK